MAFSPAFITSNSNGANTNTHTYTGISFPAGKVVVGLYAGFQSPGGVLASVTINGVAGTLRQSAPTFDGASVCELYEADVSAGTGTVVISANSGKNIIRSIIGVWNVVDGVYVTGATNTASTDSPLDVSVNTSSGDAIIVFACRSTGTPSFTPTGYTENFEHLVDTTRGATGGLKTGSSGGTPETFTVSTGGATKNAGVSVVYKAAAQTLTGTAHSSADTFGTGTISQPAGTQTITGAAHSSADTFGSGTVTTGAVTITGAAHSSVDTFGSGTVTTGVVTITGAAHSSADTFGSGTVTTGAVTITGSAHSTADTFGSGEITQGLTINGSAHSSADIFGSGAITTGAITITGAAWSSADTFGSGVISNGVTADDSVRQPGGFLPIIYVDQNGNPVDLNAAKETVTEAVEEIAKAAPKKKRKAVKTAVAVSQRVFDAFENGTEPASADIDRLMRLLVDQVDALTTLEAVMQANAQRLDDDAAFLLLMAA